MLGQHSLQRKVQGNPGITIQPKRHMLRPTALTVPVNTSDREHWPSKKVFTFVKALKDHALNIISHMSVQFFFSAKPGPFDLQNYKQYFRTRNFGIISSFYPVANLLRVTCLQLNKC